MMEGDRGVAIRGWTTDPRWDERMGVMKLYDTRLDVSLEDPVTSLESVFTMPSRWIHGPDTGSA